MKFWEAMKAMEEGKKVRNEKWTKDQYLYLSISNEILDEKGRDVGINYIGIAGSNWEIYEEKKPVDPKFKELYQYLKEENGFTNSQYGEFIQDNCMVDHLLALYTQLLEMSKYYKLD